VNKPPKSHIAARSSNRGGQTIEGLLASVLILCLPSVYITRAALGGSYLHQSYITTKEEGNILGVLY
jgi:hypothetical protein